ncbi:MAG TPA: MerR family transcriptional regulator, partial [Actinopolymorphaceae bacterium]
MEWTIHQVASRAGVTSRTLRHYDHIGLLSPSRIGANGYRYYDSGAVARLQRILLLRELGLSLDVIAGVLDNQRDEEAALTEHIDRLEAERDRLERRLQALRYTLDARRCGTDPSMEMMLDGFNDPYRDEVSSRWGEDVFARSNAWWHGKSLQQRMEWKQDTDALV